MQRTCLLCIWFQVGSEVYDFPGNPQFPLPIPESMFAKKHEVITRENFQSLRGVADKVSIEFDFRANGRRGDGNSDGQFTFGGGLAGFGGD